MGFALYGMTDEGFRFQLSDVPRCSPVHSMLNWMARWRNSFQDSFDIAGVQPPVAKLERGRRILRACW